MKELEDVVNNSACMNRAQIVGLENGTSFAPRSILQEASWYQGATSLSVRVNIILGCVFTMQINMCERVVLHNEIGLQT